MIKPNFGYMVVYQWKHDPETFHVYFENRKKAFELFYSLAKDNMIDYVKFYEQKESFYSNND